MPTDLATVPPQQISPVSPMTLIERASAAGASIEQMAQLFELKLRVEADEARKAFNDAMARFKAHPPTIAKNKHVKHNDFWHATLDECVDKITPALAAVGIRHRWNIDQSKSPQITVTCILSHSLGYSEETPLTGSADTSGSKNAIQAIGSAVTYLQRYTLLSATGLAAGGTDNDAKEAGPAKPTYGEAELINVLDRIEAARDLKELRQAYDPAMRHAQSISDQSAMNDLISAKDRKKAQL